MKKIIAFSAVIGLLPVFAFAADAFSILNTLAGILNTVVPILITLAVIYFVWGVIQYTVSTDEEAKKGARAKIIQGLIGLFVIISFWGIIAIIRNTFGVGNQAGINVVPCVPTAYNNCG